MDGTAICRLPVLWRKFADEEKLIQLQSRNENSLFEI
jgi:hypothetical protein